jgi:antitoxin YefM
MSVVSYTSARQNLKDLMDKVVEDHAPVTITRGSNPPVVMMSLEDYEAMEETMHLIRSPENARRLARGMEGIAKKRTVKKSLSDLKKHEN